MTDVVNQLGGLYDELAKLQADAKTSAFSEAQLSSQCCVCSSSLSPQQHCQAVVVRRQRVALDGKFEQVKRQKLACKKPGVTLQPSTT